MRLSSRIWARTSSRLPRRSQALNVLLKTDVAVVLMDVSMPDAGWVSNSPQVIRQHPRFQKTAIIFISGVHLTDSDRIQGYRSGAVDYISVPVVPEVLRAKVSIFVELHRKTRLLESLNMDLEQRVAERAAGLGKSEEQFRMRAELVELASEAIMVRSLDGKIQFWNTGAQKLYGWRREEVIGQDMHQVLITEFPVPRAEVEELFTRATIMARQFDPKDKGRIGNSRCLPKDHES